MGERRAVTKATARRYKAEDRTGKKAILDELCELTGRQRDRPVRAGRGGRGALAAAQINADLVAADTRATPSRPVPSSNRTRGHGIWR